MSVKRLGAVAGIGVSAAALVLSAGAAANAADAPAVFRITLGVAGAQANENVVDNPSISADGRYVAFASNATNLVSGDTNGYIDVFVRDRVAGTTTRVSVSSTGGQANGSSWAPVISADGKFVAYDSYASNLSSGDTNSATGGSDVFVHDMTTRTTTRVSTPNAGGSANGESAFASISADGRYVAYDSTARNLVPGDTNGFGDVFVWDRTTKQAVKASIAGSAVEGNAGSGLPSISADGRKVAFVSAASNFVPGDTGDYNDIYVKDLTTGAMARASVTSTGAEGWGNAEEPSLSPDGTKVAFNTAAKMTGADPDWTQDVYVRNLSAGTTTMVSAPLPGSTGENSMRGNSYNASLSADGRYVAFSSYADDLLPGELGLLGGIESVLIRDLTEGSLRRISVDAAGLLGSGNSYGPAITPDGAHVAFAAAADNLVEFDTNDAVDGFVWDAVALPAPPPPADTTAPNTTISSGPASAIRTTSATFAFTSSESGSRFECKLDAGTWTACTSPTTKSGLTRGKHIFSVRAIDAAGNVDATPATRAFTVK